MNKTLLKNKKIVIDGVIFQLQKNSNLGIARVWKNLINCLIDSEYRDDIIIIDRGGMPSFNTEVETISHFPYSFQNHDKDIKSLSNLCEDIGDCLFFSTYFTYVTAKRSVIIIHDMIPEVLAMNLSEPRWITKYKAIKNADSIICVSNNTINDLKKIYPTEVQKKDIYLLYNFVDKETFKPVHKSYVDDFKGENNLTKPYFLLVGRRTFYKNSIQFFKAFASWSENSKFQILCVGGGEIESLAKQFIDDEQLVTISYLEESDLNLAYNGAHALVYNSIYEGFGLPVIEAFSVGCPVISAKSSLAVEEISSSNTISVDPYDVKDMVRALDKVATCAERLAKAGMKIARDFYISNMKNKFISLLESELNRDTSNKNSTYKDELPVVVESSTEYTGPTVVVVGFNRPYVLRRLLRALDSAFYNQPVRLVISIDCSGCERTYTVAKDFQWSHGEKVYIEREERLGLREHILRCGDLAEKYGSIILLEDDLHISPYYYQFALQSVNYYRRDPKIAGISLYSHRFNETAVQGFSPMSDESDVYFMQLPSSWGQVWTNEQWSNFRQWYANHNGEIQPESKIPPDVLQWPDSSWKKHFIHYLIKEDKYFVYPSKCSLSTNCGDSGTHHNGNRTVLQVPLLWRAKQFKFKSFNYSEIKYDAYCELLPEIFKNNVEVLRDKNFIVDLYGTKSQLYFKSDFYLTTKRNKKALLSFGLGLKPHEINVFRGFEGGEINLVKFDDLLFGYNSTGSFRKSYYYNIPEYFLKKWEGGSLLKELPHKRDGLRRLIAEGVSGDVVLNVNEIAICPVYDFSGNELLGKIDSTSYYDEISYDTFQKIMDRTTDIENIRLIPGGKVDPFAHKNIKQLVRKLKEANKKVTISSLWFESDFSKIKEIALEVQKIDIWLFGRESTCEVLVGRDKVFYDDMLEKLKILREVNNDLEVQFIFMISHISLDDFEYILTLAHKLKSISNQLLVYPLTQNSEEHRVKLEQGVVERIQDWRKLAVQYGSMGLEVVFSKPLGVIRLEYYEDTQACKYTWLKGPLFLANKGISPCQNMDLSKIDNFYSFDMLNPKDSDFFNETYNTPEYWKIREAITEGDFLNACQNCVHKCFFM